jgi:hypothetical protein
MFFRFVHFERFLHGSDTNFDAEYAGKRTKLLNLRPGRRIMSSHGSQLSSTSQMEVAVVGMWGADVHPQTVYRLLAFSTHVSVRCVQVESFRVCRACGNAD